jgi:thiol-disulfide isomerase/thioredoxin
MSQAPSKRPFLSLKRAAICLTIATLFFVNMITICSAQQAPITVYGASWCPPCRQMKADLGLNVNGFGVKSINGTNVNFVDIDTLSNFSESIPAMQIGNGPIKSTDANRLEQAIKNQKKKEKKTDGSVPGHNPDTQKDEDEENKPKPDSPKPGGCGPGGCPGGGAGGGGLGGAGLGGGGGLLAGIGQAAMQMLPQLLQGLLQGGLQGQGSQQGLTDLQTQEELDQAFLANYVFPTQTAIAQATAIAETATAVAEQEPEDTDNQNQDSESSTVQPTPTPNPYAI